MKGTKFMCVDAVPCVNDIYKKRLKKIYDIPKDNCDVFAVYTTWSQIDWELFPSLEVLLCPCTNIDHLQPIPSTVRRIYLDDSKALFDNSFSTAEWVVIQMLKLLRKDGLEMSYKSIGFIGYGRLGQQVAKMVKGFNNSIYYYDQQITPLYYQDPEITYLPSIDDVMARSDIVVLAITSNEDTKDIINNYSFECLRAKKKRIYLVNAARANVLYGPALIKYIGTSIIKGFATDVIETYTPYVITELCRYQEQPEFYNIIMTPHVAGSGRHSREWTDTFVLNKLYEYIEKNRKDLLR
jgi:phosphoglycerate dehydrogenase-like enzyme